MFNARVATMIVGSALWLAACATDEHVNEHAGDLQGKIDALSGQVSGQGSQLQAHEGQIKTLDGRVATLEAAHKFNYAASATYEVGPFDTNSYVLSDDTKAKLSELATKLKTDNRYVYVEIQGHADHTGDGDANYVLGMKRAEVVRRYLNQQGVALNRMASISYGEEIPKSDAHDEQRRVVIMVME